MQGCSREQLRLSWLCSCLVSKLLTTETDMISSGGDPPELQRICLASFSKFDWKRANCSACSGRIAKLSLS